MAHAYSAAFERKCSALSPAIGPMVRRMVLEGVLNDEDLTQAMVTRLASMPDQDAAVALFRWCGEYALSFQPSSGRIPTREYKQKALNEYLDWQVGHSATRPGSDLRRVLVSIHHVGHYVVP
jgi:hypothetical protein